MFSSMICCAEPGRSYCVPAPRRSPRQMMLPLQMRGVTVTYGEQLALFAVDFTPPSGQISGVVGPERGGEIDLVARRAGFGPGVSWKQPVFRRAHHAGPTASGLCSPARGGRLAVSRYGAGCGADGAI